MPDDKDKQIEELVNGLEEDLNKLQATNEELEQKLAERGDTKDVQLISQEVANIVETLQTGISMLLDQAETSHGEIMGREMPNNKDVEVELRRIDATNREGFKQLKNSISKLDLTVPDNAKIFSEILTAIKNIKTEWPTDPDKPIAVRMSDGENWIKQMAQIINSGGGGGAPTVGTAAAGIRAVPNVDYSFVGGEYDYVSVSYPVNTTEVYTFKLGGSSGKVVNVVTVVYTDSTKASLSTVSKA